MQLSGRAMLSLYKAVSSITSTQKRGVEFQKYGILGNFLQLSVRSCKKKVSVVSGLKA
jgi:hypothetical protein